MSVAEAVAAAAEYFGDWPAPSEPADRINAGDVSNNADGPRIYLIDKPGAAQSVIRAGLPIVERSHPDFMALSALNYAFGGQFSARLNQNLRQDKGYSYGYNSGISWYNAPSLLSAGGSVQTAVTREAVVETLKEFADISGERPLTADELNNAQNGLRLGYPAGFERPAQLLGQLVTLAQFGLPDDYFRAFEERLSSVSLADTHPGGRRLPGPQPPHYPGSWRPRTGGGTAAGPGLRPDRAGRGGNRGGISRAIKVSAELPATSRATCGRE